MTVGFAEFRIQHLPISDRIAQIRMNSKEIFVATVQQVDFWIVQCWVAIGVKYAIVVSQEARKLGASLRGELAVEDDNIALGSVCNHFWWISLDFDQFLQNLLLRIEIFGSTNVSTFELVRLAAVNNVKR